MRESLVTSDQWPVCYAGRRQPHWPLATVHWLLVTDSLISFTLLSDFYRISIGKRKEM